MVRPGVALATFAVAASVACAPVQGRRGRAPGIAHVTHHDLHVELDGDVLQVRDRMELSADGRVVAFRVRGGLWIDSVRAGGLELDYGEAPAGDGRIVRVDLPSSATTLTVDLSGDPGETVTDDFVHLPGHSGWYPAPVGGRATRFDVLVELPAHLRVMGAGRRASDAVDGVAGACASSLRSQCAAGA